MPPPDHLAPPKSGKPDANPVKRIGQADAEEFARRFSLALGVRDKAWLARETGISTSTIHEYSKGSMPAADRLFAIADALAVDGRWLATGVLGGINVGEWLDVPIYDINAMPIPGDEYSVVKERMRIKKSWLSFIDEPPESLWIVQTDRLWAGAVRVEDKLVLCRPYQAPWHETGVYIWNFEGVRRADGGDDIRVFSKRRYNRGLSPDPNPPVEIFATVVAYFFLPAEQPPKEYPID